MRLKRSSEPAKTLPSERRSASGGSASPFPDLGTLTYGLNSALHETLSGERVTVVQRRPNRLPGRRSPSEIVTVRRKNDGRLRIFCKYGGYDWHSHGMWGVAYETEVYRKVLAAVDVTAPRFYGAYTAFAPEKTWLILEYLEGCQQLKDAPQPAAMVETAGWLARFHARTTELLSRSEIPFLKTHDAVYYRAWAKRLMSFASSHRSRFPWLAPLCEKWEELAELLSLPPRSIVHGDFYGSNVLVDGTVPFVVDWECAAVGAGAVDLAFHTEGWPEEIVELCEVEYQTARWPNGPPPEFPRQLRAARLYQQLRWLGDHSEWTSVEGVRQLGTVAADLGLI